MQVGKPERGRRGIAKGDGVRHQMETNYRMPVLFQTTQDNPSVARMVKVFLTILKPLLASAMPARFHRASSCGEGR
jgi:hypothetical protein